MELKVEVRDVEGVPIVDAAGEIDVSTVSVLKNAVISLLEADSHRAIINMDRVEYIDSNGLGTLVALMRAASDLKARLCLSFDNPMIERLFKITGLDQVTPFAHTDAEAMSLLLRN